MSRKFFLGMAVTIALLVAGAGVFHAQQAPRPNPAPPVAPELPEPPEPPEAPEAPEVFLLNDGAVHLGVTLGDVTTARAQELRLPAVAGAIVNSVQKNSAAAKAGIEKGDAIMEFDGVRVRSSAELRRLIRETPSGRTVEMKIVRDGKTRVLSAKLEASDNHFNFNYNFKTPAPEFFTEILPSPGAHRATLGISGDDLTPQLAQYFGVKQGNGVLIAEVTQGGAADKAGLKAGDVIVQVDGKSISGVEELRATLNDNFTGDTRKVSLTIVRDHHEQTINADLTRSPTGDKHTSTTAGSTRNLALAQARAQVDQQRAQAAQARAMAESQRALVRAEVLRQSQQVHEEWQRQMRDQMLLLKDQLKQMQNFHVALHQDGEI
jgi:membrane-associated protease RseP (regulator of RpoE activity)